MQLTAQSRCNHKVQQYTKAYWDLRRGKVSASPIHMLMSKTKSGTHSAGRATYMAQLCIEQLTNQTQDTYVSSAMAHGTQTEPLARSMYEVSEGVLVQEVGFILHPMIENSGASPDGVVQPNGLVEIKCPNSATHIRTLLGSKIEQKYIYQMQWQMACTETDWCDFVSFDPRMPSGLQYFCARVKRDAAIIGKLEGEGTKFLIELAQQVKELREYAGRK